MSSAKKKPPPEPEGLTRMLSLRLTVAELERLETMAGDAMPLTVLARRALAVGLDSIEADPSLLLGTKKGVR